MRISEHVKSHGGEKTEILHVLRRCSLKSDIVREYCCVNLVINTTQLQAELNKYKHL